MNKTKLVSVVIPAYNEEESIGNCLRSLQNQTYTNLEIIIVDDGSTDNTLLNAKKVGVKVFQQNHKGPGVARNYGAKNAKGEIIVFVDADMTFEKNFIRDLVKPVINNKSIGTFSKNEMNANQKNIWSKCWNINQNWPIERLIPKNYPKTAPVFRSILKKEFLKVGGFDITGDYTDDWSLSRKMGKYSTLAKGAVYYHKNPSSLKEVYKQARWIGKNQFLTGSKIRKIKSLVKYSVISSLMIGIIKSALKLTPQFLIFKLVYDFAVIKSVVQSFVKYEKYK